MKIITLKMLSQRASCDRKILDNWGLDYILLIQQTGLNKYPKS